jgi:hypothetical protein
MPAGASLASRPALRWRRRWLLCRVVRFLSQNGRGGKPESQRKGEEEFIFHDLLDLRGTLCVLLEPEENIPALSPYVGTREFC